MNKPKTKSKKILLLAIAAIITIATVTATVFLSKTQIMTQLITQPSSIDAPHVNLPDVQVGQCFGIPNPTTAIVTVIIGTGDAPKWLYMTITDAAGAYSNGMAMFGVSLVSAIADNPMGVELSMSGNTASWVTIANPSPIQLTQEGTYTFTEEIAGCAGTTAGAATVDVTFSLQDS